MPKAEPSRKIAAKKRGNRLGFWFFQVALRLFGLRGAYGLLYFVCLYYLLLDRAAVSAAMAYVRRRFADHGRLRRVWDVYALLVSQGKQLIDRFAIVAREDLFDVELRASEECEALMREPQRGLILLTAHVGNWQVTMTALKQWGRTVYLVMRPEDNPAVDDSLGISREEESVKIISPEQELGGVIEIMNVLRRGHLVSIMGDRAYGFSSVPVPFLGEDAWLPYGAFSVAAGAECPVVVLLSSKESTNRYVVDVSNVLHPRYERGRNKRVQLQEWVAQFAKLLEGYVEEHPYQCFLFHDVWRQEASDDSDT